MVGDERGSEVGERDSVRSEHDEGSEVSVDEEREPPTAHPEVISTRGLSPAIRAAMEELDGIDLSMEFSRKAVVMKSVPHFLRGPYRSDEVGHRGGHPAKSSQERERVASFPFVATALVVQTSKRREHTRASWRNVFRLSRRVSGRRCSGKADSMRKRHQQLSTGNAGDNIRITIWTDGQHALRVWSSWVSCPQGGRHWKVLVSRLGPK